VTSPGFYPVHEGLIRLGPDGPSLITGRCASCDRLHFPLLPTCPYCAGDDVSETLLAGEATLWSWTSVLREPPGYRGTVPFGFGVVEHPAGIRLVTRLTEADPTKLSAGMPMVLVTDELHTDEGDRAVSTYAFAPVGDTP